MLILTGKSGLKISKASASKSPKMLRDRSKCSRKHCGFVRTADEDLADEFPRVNRFAAGEAMVAWHQDDQRLVVHHLVAQVEGRLRAQGGDVEPAADERLR